MIYLIIPIYNKSGSFSDNIERIDSFFKGHFYSEYEIILCDDGSTDETFAAAMKYAELNPRIKVIGYKENRGRGYAIKFAGKACLDGYIIYMDLDFPETTDLNRLIEMLKYLQENDIVIGSRFLPDSRIKRFPLRAFVSKVYRWLVRLILPELKISDIDVGFKGFRADCFRQIIPFSKMDRWSWDLEFLAIARCHGLKIKEFPIDWNERYDGYNTVVNLFKDSLEEFCGILNIKLRNIKKFKKENYADSFHEGCFRQDRP